MLAMAAIVPAMAMEMNVAGNQVIMTGRVESTDFNAFDELLRTQDRKIDTVILKDSPGGDSWAGYKIGELIMSKKLYTAVAGYCMSACANIFLGGKERYFTDQTRQRPAVLGFHGSYYKISHQLIPNKVERIRRWVWQQTGYRVDPTLVETWANIKRSGGAVYFFDPQLFKRWDGTSVMYCTGEESPGRLSQDCEGIYSGDAYNMNIVTSMQWVRVNEAGAPAPKGTGAAQR